jgi:DNA-binding NtrC family response regulator
VFRICFVDDDEEFEIPLFCNIFGDNFDIIAASNYTELQSRINNRKNWNPNLFILDLYFPSGLADQKAIKALKAKPLSVKNDNAEIRTAYTNHLKIKERLSEILNAWKQNINGGLLLAEKVVADYPNVPIVFYSRKATLEDAVRCMTMKNVWSVEKKPTGKDSNDTIELTKSAKEFIIHRFKLAISKDNPTKLERKKKAAQVILEMLREFN